MIQRPGTDRSALSAAEIAEVEAIFADLHDVESPARAALLEARCAGRTEVRREVEALLAAHDSVDGFLDPPPGEAGASRLGPGAMVGSYRLIDKIGQGGMGDVFLAERADGTFSQRVAIKVTRASVRDADAARRFRSERQFLASLQHPNIVMLLDGGATPQGDAYLVMEYVDGRPITAYCRDHRLSLRDRIGLLRQVCRAVQHAHQHSIVHRDLKPANILVTVDGGVKVVDFGVAKLLADSGGAGHTMTQGLPGPLTPNYASPEQLRGLAITTACDVYSLGVLAYEILAGTRPYETTGKPLDQVLEIVLDTQPSRPSTVRPSAADGDAGAALNYSPGTLKGDLDAIVLKAISKEPARRYGSAGELADDFERFLARQPVLAREPSLGYLLHRVAVRNRALVATAALSVLAILIALSVAVWQRNVAVRAQGRAEARFRDVRQLANALIFKIHDAVAALPGSTPVRQTIVKEAIGYLEGLERDAGVDESLRLELSGAYRQIGGILGDPQRANLGDRDGALKQFERARALALPAALRPGRSFEAVAGLVSANGQMAGILRLQGQHKRSLELVQESYRHTQQAYEASRDSRLRHLLAGVCFDMALAMGPIDRQEAMRYWKEAGTIYEAELAEKPDDPNRQRNLALVEKYLGGAYEMRQDYVESAAHYARALSLDSKRLAAAPTNRVVLFDVAIDYSNLAGIQYRGGDLAKAEESYALSLQIRERLAESDPRDVLSQVKVGTSAWRLGRAQRGRGRLAESRASTTRAIDVLDAVLRRMDDSAARAEMIGALIEMAALEEITGRRASACAYYDRARSHVKARPPDSIYLAEIRQSLDRGTATCAAALKPPPPPIPAADPNLRR